MAKRKEPSVVWIEEGLIKILPTNNETIYFTDYNDKLYNVVKNVRWIVTRGYLQGCINNKRIFLHHLILPREDGLQCDHINRQKNDNRLCNLRNITRTENMINVGLSKANTSGYLGVSWNIKNEKWMASIRVDKKSKNLGYYDDPEEAHQAYKEAAEKYYPGIVYPKNIQSV